jgi:hypothetical protein
MDRPPVAVILRVIREAHQAVLAGPDEGAAFEEAIADACAAQELAPEDYRRAVASDPELQRLEEMAFREAVGAPDPGPYGEISRESPSGKPGDTVKPRVQG